MDKIKFGNYIKEKRCEQQLTQKELADRLMIDVTAVSKWERGINFPDITLIPDLCTILHVNEHELIESSNDTQIYTVKRDAARYRRIKNAVFYSLSAAYAVAIIICFAVNLLVSGTLSWFFLVAASCICAFTFLPTCVRFFEHCKWSVWLVSTLGSMILLFAVCNLYTGERWFWVASISVLLGYFAFFAPVLLHKQAQYTTEVQYAKMKKWFVLLYGVGLYLLTEAVLLCVSHFATLDFVVASEITSYCFSIVIIYGMMELFPLRRIQKLGIDSILTGGYFYGLNGVLNRLLEGSAKGCYAVNFQNWSDYSNGNVALLMMLLLTICGIVLLCIPKAK